MVKEIKRDYYLEQLIKREGNGLIKIVTGIRRCGKSYLLRTLFKNHLLENGVDEKHIIEMAFDLFDNIEYRDPKIFYPWAKEQLQDNEKYYFLLDEVQLLDEFVSGKKNMYLCSHEREHITYPLRPATRLHRCRLPAGACTHLRRHRDLLLSFRTHGTRRNPAERYP